MSNKVGMITLTSMVLLRKNKLLATVGVDVHNTNRQEVGESRFMSMLNALTSMIQLLITQYLVMAMRPPVQFKSTFDNNCISFPN